MRILVMEDEPDIAEAVVELLRRDRYEPLWVRDVGAALEAFAEHDMEAAILDVMVGADVDAGFDLAERLREAGYRGAILFLSARDATEDRVRGLDLGADDYLVKPFSLAELSARLRALLRRAADLRAPIVNIGAVEVDLAARTVRRGGAAVELSGKEFELVEWLALHPGRVVSATELQERFFPDAGSGVAVVRVYVGQLRRKLGRDAISTVPGGYRLEAS